MLTLEDRQLIVAALSAIAQTEGLGFREDELQRARMLAFLLEDEDGELFFSIEEFDDLDTRTLEDIQFRAWAELQDRNVV